MTVESPIVSIILVNYNGLKDLGPCIESLQQQTYSNYEVILVDNNSSDGSAEFVENNYPKVQVIKTGKNLGFGAGNNVGIIKSRGQQIVFTNYDVEFHPDWLLSMIKAASDEDIGLVAPKILLFDDREKVNTCGLTFQYTGHAFSRGANKLSQEFIVREEIASVTGCAFLIKREVLDAIGLFDEEFQKFGKFFYSSLEDIDLSWRAQLAGYKIIFEPAAIMYHKYIQKPLTPLRYFYLECGRYYTLLKAYRITTLTLLFPILLFSELLGWAFVTFKGPSFFLEKVKSYVWLIKNIPKVIQNRRIVQSKRITRDSVMLRRFESDTSLRHAPFPSWFSKLLEFIVNSVYRVYKAFALGVLRIISYINTELA